MSYNNILTSIETTFEIISLEGWSSVMLTARNSLDGAVYADFYFVLIILVGHYIVTNLMIAVLIERSNEAFLENHRKALRERMI